METKQERNSFAGELHTEGYTTNVLPLQRLILCTEITGRFPGDRFNEEKDFSIVQSVCPCPAVPKLLPSAVLVYMWFTFVSTP